MDYFHAKGDSRQLGIMHGQRYRKQIQKAFETHCVFDMTQRELEAICLDLDEKLRRFAPETVEELLAIAEGSELQYQQALQLNNWEEIAHLSGENKAGCCTSILFRDTLDGTILGKTTDIEPEQVSDYFLYDILPEHGFHMLILGKIGTLKCEAGMNEKGLCAGSNSSIERNQEVGHIERMTLLRRTLQQCGDVDAAVDFLKERRCYRLGLNITLTDISGRSVVAECGNTGMSVREISQDAGFATNHYLTPKMSARYDYNIWYYQNSMDRYAFLKEKLTNGVVERTVEGMKRLIKEHPKKGAICNHADCCETMFATIWIPKARTVLLCEGRPCENGYIPYQLV